MEPRRGAAVTADSGIGGMLAGRLIRRFLKANVIPSDSHPIQPVDSEFSFSNAHQLKRPATLYHGCADNLTGIDPGQVNKCAEKRPMGREGAKGNCPNQGDEAEADQVRCPWEKF